MTSNTQVQVKKQNIYEFIWFIQQWTPRERNRFYLFLNRDKEDKALTRVAKTLVRQNTSQEPIGLVKRIINLPGGEENRLYHQLKYMLFDFEFSAQKMDFFKSIDSYVFLEFKLRKNYLVAQMLHFKGSIKQATLLLTKTYNDSLKNQLLERAYLCALELSKFSSYVGDSKSLKKWTELAEKSKVYHDYWCKLESKFERNSSNHPCCGYAITDFEKTDIEYRLIKNKTRFQFLYNLDNYIGSSDSADSNESLEGMRLLNYFKRNPGLCQRSFMVPLLCKIFELWYRNGAYLRIERLFDMTRHEYSLGSHQKLPLIRFFLHYYLKTENYLELEKLINFVRKENVLSQIDALQANVFRITAIKNLCLQQWNSLGKQLMESKSSDFCVEINAELRIVEMIALMEIHKLDLLEDRLESLRRFVQRHADLNNKETINNQYKLIRDSYLSSNIPHLKQVYKSDVYNLSDIIDRQLNKTLNRIYKNESTSLSIAAEP